MGCWGCSGLGCRGCSGLGCWGCSGLGCWGCSGLGCWGRGGLGCWGRGGWGCWVCSRRVCSRATRGRPWGGRSARSTRRGLASGTKRKGNRWDGHPGREHGGIEGRVSTKQGGYGRKDARAGAPGHLQVLLAGRLARGLNPDPAGPQPISKQTADGNGDCHAEGSAFHVRPIPGLRPHRSVNGGKMNSWPAIELRRTCADRHPVHPTTTTPAGMRST